MKRCVFPSLEGLLKTCFIITGLLILALWLLLGLQKGLSALNLGLSTCLVFVLLAGCFHYVYQRVLTAFEWAKVHLDEVGNQDCLQEFGNQGILQYAKPAFQQGAFQKGVVTDFHNELEKLSRHLHMMKSQYDENVVLVYQLIEQLDSPILMFNQFSQLTYANAAFEKLFSQPWHMFKYAPSELLGLEFIDQNWRFAVQEKNSHWQIRHSEFTDQNKNHQLLVFTNIESVLRKNQLAAWQQLIGVIGHEIRDSLTPISALSQDLSAKLLDTSEQQALSVINERCLYLQDFVSRYTSVSKPLQLNQQKISIKLFAIRLQGLFKEVNLSIIREAETIWADPTFIEQALLNVIKNADEASTFDKAIQLIFSQTSDTSLIEIIDEGHGFANLDNLFVPLYTTKQNGQGIGLSFCRNIVEHHKGMMGLVNNADGSGVTVSISLPLGPLTTS